MRILFATLVLLPALGSVAQQCTPDDTPLTCWRKFNSLAARTGQKVATTNTGTPTAESDATATALRDFLSIFAAGVDTGRVTENGTGVTLDWNLPFPYLEDNDRIKLQTLFNDPALAQDVQTALGPNAAAAKSKLTNFDDVTALIAYDPVNRRFGRSIAAHVSFLDALEQTSPDVAVQLQKLGDMLARLPSSTPFVQDTKFSTIPDAAQQKAIIDQVVVAARLEQQAAASSSAIVQALTQIINNQPQAYVAGIYHVRNALVGPDEWSLKGTFEVSPKSLNRFVRKNQDVCGDTAVRERASAAKCVSRLLSFAGPDIAFNQPDANDRLSFAIEYRRAKSEIVDLSQYAVATPVTRPGTHSLVYSLTYGHPLTTAKIKDARLDLAVNYANISNDPTQKDRFVASLTFSQKINDKTTLPLSLTYANHTAYLPQTDRRLGIHFGIAYKIPDMSGQ